MAKGKVGLVCDFDPEPMGWNNKVVHRVSPRSKTGMWVGEGMPHHPADLKAWLVLCDSLSDLQNKLQNAPAETPVAHSVAVEGPWTEADLGWVVRFAF